MVQVANGQISVDESSIMKYWCCQRTTWFVACPLLLAGPWARLMAIHIKNVILQPAQPHPFLCQDLGTPFWEYRIGDARNRADLLSCFETASEFAKHRSCTSATWPNFPQCVDSRSTPTLPAHSKVRDLMDLYSTISATWCIISEQGTEKVSRLCITCSNCWSQIFLIFATTCIIFVAHQLHVSVIIMILSWVLICMPIS